VIRDWRAFAKLGVHEAYAPTAFHSRVKLDYPVHLGGYRSPVAPAEPMCLHLVHVPYFPNSRMSARNQAHAGRGKLLYMTFAEFEREIRAQLDAMLAPGGFDAARDILAITVNRWSHGYAYSYNSLFDRPGDNETIPALARQRIGRVTIANSDASWEAYAQAAIDQAWRAVEELAAL
jgi:spermidine dehydrogenase